jgi:hypothetical protein
VWYHPPGWLWLWCCISASWALSCVYSNSSNYKAPTGLILQTLSDGDDAASRHSLPCDVLLCFLSSPSKAVDTFRVVTMHHPESYLHASRSLTDSRSCALSLSLSDHPVLLKLLLEELQLLCFCHWNQKWMNVRCKFWL